ncbi:MBL fold metallo-hydrolase [Candidatus Thorarchaeota archaeon]|nr:MAG: MBL fold metallo-hydrolase [Candidatus Thorarchaeota archaeon]
MRITTIRSEGLAALSYFVSSESEAMVIDPRRDASFYQTLAANSDCVITHIFETHRNEDYVSGSLELQSYSPKAEIAHSKETKFGYGDIDIADGDIFQVGMMKVTCLNTPGHTDDSMCYIVADSSVGPDPIVAFTGDTLFVNEVGRTDLVDINKHEQMSRKLYSSLHERLLPVGDDVIIHPAHGAGSVCGGAIGDREFSTIGYEKKNNIWLSLDEDEFIAKKVNQRLTLTSYFKRCEKINTEGPPLLSSLPSIEELDVDEYDKLLRHPDHRGIDTRHIADFLDSYIPGSISISLSNIGLLAGWVLRSDQTFTFILGNFADLEQAKNSLYRVGLDNITGYLKDGFRGWLNSRKVVEHIPTLLPPDLNDGLKKNEFRILDVRESHEYDMERIPTSSNSPLTRLDEEASDLDTSKKIVTVCPSGFRSTTAASIMKHNGLNDVAVFISGLKKWKSNGYPVEG